MNRFVRSVGFGHWLGILVACFLVSQFLVLPAQSQQPVTLTLLINAAEVQQWRDLIVKDAAVEFLRRLIDTGISPPSVTRYWENNSCGYSSIKSKTSVFEIPYGSIAAATVLGTVPLVLLVLLFQHQIVQGLRTGAVKG